MGTRNLTMVISGGKTKVAQYGQWDGYPEGQGLTALNFLRNNDLKRFQAQLEKVRFPTKTDIKKLDTFMESIGSKDGWMTMEQSAKYQKEYPLLTRDNGAGILELINNLKKKTFIHDSSNFAGDSLFCEWAYVIDFDKNTFEVYEGFNKTPLKKTERFANIEREKDSEYYPVRLVKKYKLDKLPTEKKFLKDFKVEAE